MMGFDALFAPIDGARCREEEEADFALSA